jgi:hypothetical protein
MNIIFLLLLYNKMTDTLRAKQNMEILDVFKDLHRQIVGRQNKQIQAFPETLLPKTQRDLGAEVNTDKAVERINQVLETKLGSLEYLVGEFATGADIDPMFMARKGSKLPGKQAEDIITNTGDIVPLWNGIVRLYKEPGLSRESQNIIKVKVQELTPNLEAIVYGFNSALDYIFRQRVMNASLMLAIMEYLRTLSVYTVIKQQVDSGLLELLSVEALHRTYKNLLEEQTSDRQAIIKRYAPRGDITSTPIRNIPDFDVFGRQARLKAIAEELGIPVRAFASANIGSMTGQQFNEFVAKIQNEKQDFVARGFTRQEEAIIQEAQEKMDQIQAYEISNRQNDKRIAQYEKLIRQLREEEPLSQEEAERLTEEVPEEPVIPDTPDRIEFPTGEGGDEAYERAMREYREMMIPVEIALASRQAIIEHNEGLLARVKATVQRNQTIFYRQRLIASNKRDKTTRIAQIEEIRATLPGLQARAMAIKNTLGRSVRAITDSYTGKVRAKAMKDENLAQSMEFQRAEALRRGTTVLPLPRPGVAPRRVVIEEEAGDEKEPEAPAEPSGEGRKAETRGLASLRKNYGFESMSDTDDSDESESDDDRPFDFDDAGNDMYYSKPMRR